MIVEIDGYFENELVAGKTCSIMELSRRVTVTKTHCTNIDDFTDTFCKLFNFERLPSKYDEGVRLDCVIDIDTGDRKSVV